MPLDQRCSKGHYYDPTKHTTCPYCGVAGLDIPKTNRPGAEHQPTRPRDERGEGDDDRSRRTLAYFEDRIGINPPVGWLVCIDGPERGRDYRILAESNSIGRDPTMQISIRDETISGEDHAFVIYDPETNTYAVRPGVARGLVYLNRGPVYETTPLRPHDEIKLGKTTLLFVPLCGEFGGKSFRWS
jgi:hypothetical protein